MDGRKWKKNEEGEEEEESRGRLVSEGPTRPYLAPMQMVQYQVRVPPVVLLLGLAWYYSLVTPQANCNTARYIKSVID